MVKRPLLSTRDRRSANAILESTALGYSAGCANSRKTYRLSTETHAQAAAVEASITKLVAKSWRRTNAYPSSIAGPPARLSRVLPPAVNAPRAHPPTTPPPTLHPPRPIHLQSPPAP